MQQMVSKPQPNNGMNTQAQTMIITAITVFALSGLILGLAVGAFTRPAKTQTADTTTKAGTIPPVTHIPTPSPTMPPQTQALGYPVVSTISYNEIADGTTTYTLNVYPVDRSIDAGHGKQINANDITCKFWFTKDQNITDTLNKSGDTLKDINKVSQPFGNEEPNILLLANDTQTKMCSQTGNTTWTYKIAPSTPPDTYNLVVLTDWRGQHYNWYFSNVTIKAPGSK